MRCTRACGSYVGIHRILHHEERKNSNFARSSPRMIQLKSNKKHTLRQTKVSVELLEIESLLPRKEGRNYRAFRGFVVGALH